ncbi:hypothetical protein EDB83DRAFT_2530689 [Lactarius deliciosus]|nr:hypothetical protein EDB83DRAFT_2530689 [Lactarius deliciosus]
MTPNFSRTTVFIPPADPDPRKHACTEDEATQYLAAYKKSKHCPPTLICERIFKTPGAVLHTAFTSIPRLNRTSFETLHLQSLVPGIHTPTSVPPQIRLEKGHRAEERVQATLPHGHGRRGATTTSSLLPCGLAAAAAIILSVDIKELILCLNSNIHPATVEQDSALISPSVELRKHPGVPQLPDLKFRREEKRLRRSVRAETFRPVPTTGKYDDSTEPTLSSLACLVAMHGVSPAVSKMPSIGSRKAKVQEGKAKGKRFCSLSTRSIQCRATILEDLKRHDLNASLPLSGGRTSAQASPPSPPRNPLHEDATTASAFQQQQYEGTAVEVLYPSALHLMLDAHDPTGCCSRPAGRGGWARAPGGYAVRFALNEIVDNYPIGSICHRVYLYYNPRVASPYTHLYVVDHETWEDLRIVITPPPSLPLGDDLHGYEDRNRALQVHPVDFPQARVNRNYPIKRIATHSEA